MAKTVEAYVPGLNRLLRDLRALPKEAQAELRDASQQIADRHMVPAWRAAAMRAGPWGPKIAASVRSKRDRIPAVMIGGNRRGTFSGGASPTMVRAGTDLGLGARGARQSGWPRAFDTRREWTRTARPAYIGQALAEWGEAVSGVCRDFNNGKY